MLRVCGERELRALNEVVVGETVFLRDDGDVAVTLIARPNESFNRLVADLVYSRRLYGLEFREGVHPEILNQDRNPDERWRHRPEGKPAEQYPPMGFDGYVVLDPLVVHVVDGVTLSLADVLRHELAECYAKVEFGLQYIHAHRWALDYGKPRRRRS